MEFYETKGILLFVTTGMHLEGTLLSKISQAEEDKSPHYLWNLKRAELIEAGSRKAGG